MKKLILSMILLGLMIGCTSTPEKPSSKAAVEDRSVGQNTPSTSSVDTKSVTQAPVKGNPLTDPNNILSKRSVYFDLDSSAVKDEYQSLIEAHAKYLRDHGDTKVTIQGNTDERGSREYNISLAQRRADSVKKVMSVLGISEKQIETVSLGEEKPKASGHDEESWAQNRRADIVYQGE